jgi:hypothetical protein
MGPSAGFNLKYNYNDIFVFRGGITWGQVFANDNNNHQAALKNRNLNFKTNIVEGSLCLEVNLVEPEFFTVYPYVFAGIGVFHFDPYTYDDNGKKTYLQPLGTEGQGLATYPERKPYALTQLCIPIGGGMKIYLNKRFDIIYELAGRKLFTDYLDDVSETYVNMQTLLAQHSPKAAELAWRQTNSPLPNEGDIRGNPAINDWYFVSCLKLLVRMGRDR